MDNDKVKDMVQNSDPATEPIDLAQAFRQYNQANAAAAKQDVESTEPVEGTAGEAGPQPAAEAAGDAVDQDAEQQVAVAASSDGGSGAGPDGSADVIEPVDYNPAREQILKDVQQRAMMSVRDEFRKQEINMWSINDLYERDEQTGRVRFRNPDDPQHDFASRFEAQQFVDAMNRQITNEFRNAVNQKQREIMQQEAPKLRTLEFAPKYNAMDEVTKGIFDDMVEPYAVRNSAGEVIGFNVDLDAVAGQASKIASRFAVKAEPQQAQAEAKAEPTSPALDMKTGATQSAMPEPKTIGEALKMYDQSKKKEKKNGR